MQTIEEPTVSEDRNQMSKSAGDGKNKEPVIQTFMKALNYFKELFEQRKHFTFLLVGRTGVGKSSTINSLLGEEVAKVGDFDPTTREVEEYQCEHGGVKFTVYDTPGFCDDLPEMNKDAHYLKLITERVKEIDCLWYVSPLDQSRLTSDDLRTFQMLTETFGSQIWDRSLIVFTCADKVPEGRFEEFMRERTKRIRAAIAKHGRNPAAEKIPTVAVANGHQKLPDGKEWLPELFLATLERCSQAGVVPFLMAMRSDLVPVKQRKFRPAETTKESALVQAQTHVQAQQPQVIVVQQPLPAPSPEPQPRIVLDQSQKARVRKRLTETLPQTIGAGAALGGAVGFATGGFLGVLPAAALGAIGGAIFGLLSWLFDW